MTGGDITDLRTSPLICNNFGWVLFILGLKFLFNFRIGHKLLLTHNWRFRLKTNWTEAKL